ncbi:hypothetical protein C8J34_104143 [Rhizobium sp. PP-F2F-G36]|nr:hypothetical protein C8J34_104143 [Rhizobium sp. PP-F2F-G36]
MSRGAMLSSVDAPYRLVSQLRDDDPELTERWYARIDQERRTTSLSGDLR